MLVLSRKVNERILFPNLGVAIEILRVAGSAIRIGIEAPKDVQVLRAEVAEREGSLAAAETARAQRHELRNRLHTANLALHLAQKQMAAGWTHEAESTLDSALGSLAELDQLAGGEKSAAARTHAKRRALLVEDNPNERELLAAYLRLSGYEVDVADDGLAAMRFLSEHERPDLVLLDMQLPRMNGRETVTAIRCNPAYRGLKVFAVSGSDQQAVGVTCGERGVDRWFSKPLDPSDFIHQLDRELHVASA